PRQLAAVRHEADAITRRVVGQMGPRPGSIRSAIDMLVDSPLTAFARGTFGGVLLGAAAVTVLVAVLVWASRPGETERRLAAAASVIGAAFAVGDGYTIWMDVVVGAAIFALPVLAFELLRSRGLNC